MDSPDTKSALDIYGKHHPGCSYPSEHAAAGIARTCSCGLSDAIIRLRVQKITGVSQPDLKNIIGEVGDELYALCGEIEKLPAGEQQTKVVIECSRLMKKLSCFGFGKYS